MTHALVASSLPLHLYTDALRHSLTPFGAFNAHMLGQFDK